MVIKRISFIEAGSPGLHIFSKFPIPRIGAVLLSTILRERGPVRSVLITNRIIGCPHEEGIDYPEGDVCPKCPYWAHRDRWTGTTIH